MLDGGSDMWSPGCPSPNIARLSASVPPLVNTTSDARQPSSFAAIREHARRRPASPARDDGWTRHCRNARQSRAAWTPRPPGARESSSVIEVNPSHHDPFHSTVVCGALRCKSGVGTGDEACLSGGGEIQIRVRSVPFLNPATQLVAALGSFAQQKFSGGRSSLEANLHQNRGVRRSFSSTRTCISATPVASVRTCA